MSSEKLFTRSFTLMAIGQFISLFGNTLQRFALSLFILDLTGSAAVFATILSITLLPQIFLAPFGGAIADRFSKKKIMIILDTLSGGLLILFAFLLHMNNSEVLIIGILMCIMAIIQSIYDPSVRAAIPVMVSESNLTSANSVVSQVSAISSLLGPVAAGFLYGTFGIEVVFIINIVSFLFSAVLELFLVIPHKKQEIKGNAFVVFCTDIKNSFSFLLHEKKIVFYMLLIASSFNLFLTPIYTIGVPYVEKVLFGVTDQMYGISEGCVGLGMVAGALLVNIISKKFPMGKMHVYFGILIVLTLGMGVTTLPSILGTGAISYLSYGLFTGIGFIFAFCLSIINILCMTFMQLETPMEMMGKIMALITSISVALMPVGQMIFGGLYELFSESVLIIYIIVALCLTITTIVIYRLLKSKHFTETKTAKQFVNSNIA